MKYLTKQTFSLYWKYSSVRKMGFFLTLLFIVIGDVGRAAVPYMYKELIDALSIEGTTTEMLLPILGFILLFALVHHLCIRTSIYVWNKFSADTMRDIAVAGFTHLHRHSHTFFNDNFVGSLVKKVNRFYWSYERLYDRLVWDFFPILLNILLFVGILSFRNVWFGIIIILWASIHITINYAFSRYKLKYDYERSKYESKVTGILADTVSNHSNLKLFGGYQREVDNFYNESTGVNKLRLFTWNLSNHFEVIQGVSMIVAELIMIYVALIYWERGSLTIGDFVLVQTYMGMIFHKLWGFGRVIRDTYESLADAEEMTEIFEAPIEIVEKKNAKPLVVDAGRITLEKVTFQYNKTRTVIDQMDLDIVGGQKVALVGHSGAGKSTIIKMLLRMHDISKGKLMIDGQKVGAVTLESLWQHISYVPQDPMLFHRSLMENIRYSRPDATDEEVITAAKQAHADEFVSTFPQGYDTLVGERGVKLSGGERQRIAIARAILKNAPILILDEATSSLDSESEMLIQDALDTLMKEKTVIVVAHRLSTIMKMDRILVVEAGKIVEDGTHKQLLRKKTGMYRKLWDIQAGDFLS